MLDDLEMGRGSEIDYLQGEIVALAQRMGQSAPYNQIILDHVNAAFAARKSPQFTGRQIYQILTSQ